MLFNSLTFLIFLAIVLAFYYNLRHKWQNRMLLVASYVFYSWWDPRFLSLILVQTVIDYIAGLKIEESNDTRRRRLYLIVSMTSNMTLLAFFKYFHFFVDSAQELLAFFGMQWAGSRLNIILPVGISFYTFQTMSYTIDIYRREMKPTRDFLDFALFVSFFPHLVAGPIMRASYLLPQVQEPRTVSWEKCREGLYLIAWGLYKKVVIADNLAPLANRVFSLSATPTGSEVAAAVFAFAFQIYCDFSGYSDIARGLAKLMGFDFILNFNIPYIALNPADFWHRWHISLSTWLRDYLYIPLGGNRKGPVRTYVNLALTMLLGGLWHGARWNFVLWGAYQGLLLIVHRFATRHFRWPEFKGWQAGAWTLARVAIMFLFTCYGWLLFRAYSFTQIVDYTSALFVRPEMTPLASFIFGQVLSFIWPLVAMQAVQFYSQNPEWLPQRRQWFLSLNFYLLIVIGILTYGRFGGQEFIYFQF